jgi:hypothetical protein
VNRTGAGIHPERSIGHALDAPNQKFTYVFTNLNYKTLLFHGRAGSNGLRRRKFMSNGALTLAAAVFLGGLALSAGSASAAPSSLNSIQGDSAILTQVQMVRMERRMMNRM